MVMKIVFQGQLEWESKPHAEKELGRRMRDACINIGHESINTSNIQEIENFHPDIVFPLHHFTPKLFDAYTIGCMWNPIKDVENRDAVKMMHTFENIKSYDACAIASPIIEKYLDHLFFKSPISREKYVIYPSANKTKFSSPKQFKKIAYVGSNWQGDRHKDLFLNSDKIGVYGPEKSWEYLKKQTSNYYGEVPFENNAVQTLYQECGMGLCFHSEHHLKENVPNMRIFEMAAAGILIFADKLKFIEEEFGDTVIYIDTKQSNEKIIEQIDYYYNWAVNNKEKAIEMAKGANEIFNKKFTLEKLLTDIINGYKERKADPVSLYKTQPTVEIIVRTDGNRSNILDSVKSIVDQTYQKVSLCFVYWGNDKKGFEKMVKGVIPPHFEYRIIEQKDRKDRSYNFYTGIRASSSDYIGFLDDDDIFFKDHVEILLRHFEHDNQCAVVYSGIVKRDLYDNSSKRRLAFYHDFIDFEKESFITSNSYLVKRDSIPYSIMQNNIPIVSTGEDRMFLDILHRGGAKFAFSEKVTALFTKDNVDFSNVSFNSRVWRKNANLYRAFLRDSVLDIPYIEKIGEERPRKGLLASIIHFMKLIIKKIIPFKVRRFFLLIVKDLVSSSSGI